MLYTGKLLVRDQEAMEAEEKFSQEQEKLKDLGVEVSEQKPITQYKHKKVQFDFEDVSDLIENAIETELGEKDVVVVQKYNGQSYLVDESFDTLARLRAESLEKAD